MSTPTSSPIKTKTRAIDGLLIRYAERAPREVSAILLSPWPESLYTFEQIWSRLAEHAWADAADEYANLIIEWWKGGYERSSWSKQGG